MGLSVQEQAAGMLKEMNQALASQHPTVLAIVNAKTDDKEAMGKRAVALLHGAQSLSEALQQQAMIGVSVIAIASTTIPGELRCETEETLGATERHFIFYRDQFRVGELLLSETGKESGKVGGGITVLIDEATLTWPEPPKFSSN